MRRPQGGNDAAAPPSPDSKTGSRVSPGSRAGKNEQRQDDASKEVTAPVGIAVVCIMLGFCPGPDPNAWDTLQGVAFGLIAGERRVRDAVAAQAG
jgi:hypothetical protein